MKKLLAVVVTIIICALVYVGVSRFQNSQNGYDESAKIQNEKIKNLYKEKQEIQNQIESIENEINTSNVGTLILLYTDINKKHLDESVKINNGEGYHGVFALSKEDIKFNDKDSITKKQLKNLQKKGYEVVIKVNTGEDPKELYDEFVKNKIDVKGFYVVGEVNQTIIESIKQTKCNAVIADAFKDIDDELLCIIKYGNMYPSIKTKFTDSVEYSDTIAISVGYGGIIYEEFSESNYHSMFKTINPYVEDDLTAVCNITEAIDRNNEFEEYQASHYTKQEEEIQSLENRLEEINNEILNLGQ